MDLRISLPPLSSVFFGNVSIWLYQPRKSVLQSKKPTVNCKSALKAKAEAVVPKSIRYWQEDVEHRSLYNAGRSWLEPPVDCKIGAPRPSQKSQKLTLRGVQILLWVQCCAGFLTRLSRSVLRIWYWSCPRSHLRAVWWSEVFSRAGEQRVSPYKQTNYTK